VRWLNEEHARGRTDLALFSKEFDEVVKPSSTIPIGRI